MTRVIEVRGAPAPQGSKRHLGNGRMVEMSAKVGPWREAVRAETQRAGVALGAGVPVAVSVVFFLPRPAGHYGTGRNAGKVKLSAPCTPSTRPDLDKLVRSTLDGLKTGGAYADDAQVVTLSAGKVYAANGQPPGAEITLRVLS